MNIHKAVITAAGRNQRALPLQTLVDRDGNEKTVLRLIIEEVLTAKIDEICVVVSPGDEAAYARAAVERAGMIRFIEQPVPLGYGNALHCSQEFVGNEPFLHLVGDHLHVSQTGIGSAQQLVQVATEERCAVSTVQATRENVIQHYGTVAGPKISDRENLYRIETVIEKPTPTEAEQKLIVAGMRAGHYLCFFGMHVFTPAVFELLARHVSLSSALAELAKQERYLALHTRNRRYDVGVKYGLLRAQLALSLSGDEREDVLSQIIEVLAASNGLQA